MPRLASLPGVSCNSLLTLPGPQQETAPSTPLTKPLAERRLAVVTTAGMHVRNDRPFIAGDPSYRVIPSTSRPDEMALFVPFPVGSAAGPSR